MMIGSALCVFLELVIILTDKSSRLLVTTRNKYIATYDGYTHDEMKLKLLDPEKSWELFLMKALIDKSNGGWSEELEPIGREIVKRCNGLPLAISLVGGLLAKTPTNKGWEQVLNLISSHWGWEQDSNLNSIFTRSDLSYQNLSQKLKSCFVCLAFFKEDAIIPEKRLLRIWIGLGLIQKDYTGMTSEEIGREYLDELINQNMLQIVDRTDNRVESCYLHGVLRDVCLRRANEEICLEMLNLKEAERVADGSWNKSRHCVVNGGNLETLLSKRGKYLRSLFLLSNESGDVDMSSLSWKMCQSLKILHLDGITLSTFPDSFQSFIRLKYLRIRRRRKTHLKFAFELEDNYIEPVKLPSWLDLLTHLEILDMKGEKVQFPKDPDALLKMKRLRYFSAYCVGGPMSINSWDDIETLKYMRQEDWMKCFSRMEFTCNVRKLGLFIDPFNPPHEWNKVRASLQELDFLENLHLRWSPIIPIKPEIVPKIPSLTKLKLSGKLAKCPTSSMFPPNLSRLTLAFSGLHEDPMAELSKLPNLSYLKLLGNAFKGQKMEVLPGKLPNLSRLKSLGNAFKDQKMEVLPGGFLCLKALSLKEMFHLKYIDLKEGGMPLLEQLRIQQCPSLKTINLPEHVTIKHIT